MTVTKSKTPEETGENGSGNFYYLHENGNLIHKRTRPEIESGGFVRRVWCLDTSNRLHAWIILIEALAMGARPNRITELANRWGVDDTDAQEFVKNLTDGDGKPLMVLKRDGNVWCATFVDFVNLQESPAGFGTTALEAFSNLVDPKGLEGKECAFPGT